MQMNFSSTESQKAVENKLPADAASQASDDSFFKNLPARESYADVTKPENFLPAPLDWYVVITDVVNSTGAIESGQYKNVNLLGATTIIGLLNVADAIEFPFVFGGDGASFLIPPVLLASAKRVLVAAKERARQIFNFELRVGLVPVKKVVADGYAIHVAKLKVSDHFAQAIFAGGGISHAEKLIKRPPPGESYELEPDDTVKDADFSGLECRWNPIASDKGEIVSLLIQALAEDDQAKNRIYRDVIREIETVFGRKETCHPVAQHRMELSTRRSDLVTELRAKKGRLPWYLELTWLSWMLVQTLAGRYGFRRRVRVGNLDFGKYHDVLIQNTDYQKFDDMIRMVISCSAANRQSFEDYLRGQWTQGRLVYGLHVTDKALLTCLVFDRRNRHFHFVDGSNGGYALAAKTLKQQLKEIAAQKKKGSK
jgi:hypothetical protein